jgi:hypothetical protein
MSTRTLVAAVLVVAIAIVGGWFMKHRSAEKDPQAAERERNADWGKTLNDAKRMEEISRRRAEEQRARTPARPE